MKTLRQSSDSSSFVFLARRDQMTNQPPAAFSRSSTVSENRSGPLLAVTIVLPRGLTARPKGPGPVMYWMPSGAMTLPPGRMLAAPGRRIAGRMPAGRGILRGSTK